MGDIGRFLFCLICLSCLAATSNIYLSGKQARGLVGYESVAEFIGERPEKGNIMITALADADFIFRIRCQPTTETLDRRIIRGDRTLAIRHPNYSKADSEIIAKSYPEVYDIIREGRIRFIVTQGPRHDKDKDWQESDFEIKLAHQAMVANQKDYVHLY